MLGSNSLWSQIWIWRKFRKFAKTYRIPDAVKKGRTVQKQAKVANNCHKHIPDFIMKPQNNGKNLQKDFGHTVGGQTCPEFEF